MKVVVLGAGVVGVCNAWYLAQEGHEVVVVDRQPDVALETSFANAGEISPSYASPWAAPGVPQKAMKWLVQDLSPLRINPLSGSRLYTWVWQMLMNCSEDRYQKNKARMMRMAFYSRDKLRDLQSELGLEYEQRSKGTLQVFRTQAQLKAVEKDIQALKAVGIDHHLYDVNGCIDQEPGLAFVADKLVGGLYMPADDTGDCLLFTQQLAEKCKEAGVVFKFNHRIESLEKGGPRITGAVTDQGVIKGDAFVMALGSYSSELLKPLGLELPVYPVKGYSLTVPIIDEERAPQSTVMDETYKVAVTRFDNRIRVGGTAELTGFNTLLRSSRKANVTHVLNDLFGGAGDTSKCKYWTGLRPMTPDGTPLVCESGIENLYLNNGHGTLGWTMAAGSGKYLSDVISDKAPDISGDGFGLDRYTTAK